MALDEKKLKQTTKVKPKEKPKVKESVHSGFWALGVVLTNLQIPFTIKEATNFLGSATKINSSDIIYLVREHYQTEAKRKKIDHQKLNKFIKPLLLEWGKGDYCLFKGIKNEKYLIQNQDGEKLYSIQDFEQHYNGYALLFKKEVPEFEEDFMGDFGFGWIFRSMLRQKKIFYNVMLAALAIQFFALVTPLFTMIIIDKVFSANGLSTLYVLIFGLFAMSLFDFVLGQSRKKLLLHLTNKLDVVLLSKIFRHMSHLPMSFFYNKQTGDLVSRVKDLETVRNFITGQALSLFIDFPFTIIFIIVMYLFNPLLTGIVIISTVLFFVIFGFLSPFMKSNLQKKSDVQADNQSFLYEMISSAEIFKTSSLEKQLQKKWEEMIVKHSKYSVGSEKLQGTITQLSGLLSKFTTATCLLVGALSVLNGDMTAGQLIAFNMLVGRVVGPIQKMAQTLQQLTQIKISMKRVTDIFNSPLEPAFRNYVSSIPTIKGEIEFKNVSYRYQDQFPLVLDNINLSIKAGTQLGIIGPSGSGKTTLTKIILRLLLPTSGKVLVDGMNIAQIDPVVLRNYFGVVNQENILFNLSVRENIALAKPQATMEQIELVAHLAGADDFIRALPKGYDTILGERGHVLSMGERQRISIARALITDPKILIFDEATSFLDYESEQALQKNMREIGKDRTVIIVSHRISSLRHAQQIICVENGRIEEDGKPIELLKNTNGRFYQLFQLQRPVLSQINDKKKS